MRKLLAALVLGAGLCVAAPPALSQSAPPPATEGWGRVQALPSGVAVHVHGKGHNSHCKLKTVTEDSLTCVTGDGSKIETFQKSDIRNIRIPHRGRSAAAGAALGAGVGAGIGLASGGGSDNILPRGDLALIFAIPLAIIGALVGVATDFTIATIYRGN